MTNCLGSFAGIFGPLSAGLMLAQSGNWLLPFFVATAVGAVCATLLLLVPIRPITFAGLAPAEAAAGGVVD